MASTVEAFATSFAGSSWPEPVSLPSDLELGIQDQQNLLSGNPTERSWSVAPIQAPGTAPDDNNFIGILFWMPLLDLGLGGGPFRKFHSQPADHSSLPLSQRNCIIPNGMGY
eukprot:1158729-Pelagomonas_calceolata.AAC.2